MRKPMSWAKRRAYKIAEEHTFFSRNDTPQSVFALSNRASAAGSGSRESHGTCLTLISMQTGVRIRFR
jgi:hypothetical protein